MKKPDSKKNLRNMWKLNGKQNIDSSVVGKWEDAHFCQRVKA